MAAWLSWFGLERYSNALVTSYMALARLTLHWLMHIYSHSFLILWDKESITQLQYCSSEYNVPFKAQYMYHLKHSLCLCTPNTQHLRMHLEISTALNFILYCIYLLTCPLCCIFYTYLCRALSNTCTRCLPPCNKVETSCKSMVFSNKVATR